MFFGELGQALKPLFLELNLLENSYFILSLALLGEDGHQYYHLLKINRFLFIYLIHIVYISKLISSHKFLISTLYCYNFLEYYGDGEEILVIMGFDEYHNKCSLTHICHSLFYLYASNAFYLDPAVTNELSKIDLFIGLT